MGVRRQRIPDFRRPDSRESFDSSTLAAMRHYTLFLVDHEYQNVEVLPAKGRILRAAISAAKN